jgi:hypothetical protein
MKEASLKTRYARSQEALNTHARTLPPLHIGDRCFVQNGAGNFPKRWDKSGTVTEVLDYDKYIIKIDGSGRVTTRNRKFLRQFTPISTDIAMPALPPHWQSSGTFSKLREDPVAAETNCDRVSFNVPTLLPVVTQPPKVLQPSNPTLLPVVTQLPKVSQPSNTSNHGSMMPPEPIVTVMAPPEPVASTTAPTRKSSRVCRKPDRLGFDT